MKRPKHIVAGWNKGKRSPWASKNLPKNQPPWNKGKRGTYTTSLKGRKRPDLSGKNHPNWRGGFDRKRYAKEYRIKNSTRINYLNLQRIVRKNNADGTHTFGEWELLKKQYGNTCPCCGKTEPRITLTQDHIVPLSKGGSDYIENIQPLCRGCNSKKHTTITKYPKK